MERVEDVLSEYLDSIHIVIYKNWEIGEVNVGYFTSEAVRPVKK